MKIGIIFISYNNKEYLEKSLSSWILARLNKLDGHEFVISAVSLPFEEYKDIEGFERDEETPKVLNNLILHEQIDYLTTFPEFIKEHEARTLGLGPLLIDGCSHIILADGDEIPTQKDISNIIKFVENNKLIDWFKLCYKNYVFV